MLTLRGYIRGEEYTQYFTADEKPLALYVAKVWLAKGFRPVLYDSNLNMLLNHRDKMPKRKAA